MKGTLKGDFDNLDAAFKVFKNALSLEFKKLVDKILRRINK